MRVPTRALTVAAVIVGAFITPIVAVATSAAGTRPAEAVGSEEAVGGFLREMGLPVPGTLRGYPTPGYPTGQPTISPGGVGGGGYGGDTGGEEFPSTSPETPSPGPETPSPGPQTPSAGPQGTPSIGPETPSPGPQTPSAGPQGTPSIGPETPSTGPQESPGIQGEEVPVGGVSGGSVDESPGIQGEELPTTGDSTGIIVAAGASLFGVGVMLVLLARRRSVLDGDRS